MDNVKEYIRLFGKFQTDEEIAMATGVTLQEIQKIKNQLNKELWAERIRRSKKRTGRF